MVNIIVMLFSFSMMVAMLLSAHGVEVRSATGCPSSEAIAAKLAPLLSGGAGAEDVAWVEGATPEPDGRMALRLRLVRSDASVITDRRLAVQGGCDEMADTIATVLAAWETPPGTQPAAGLASNEQGAQSAVVAKAVAPPGAEGLQAWLGAGGGAILSGGITTTGSIELLAGWIGSHAEARVAVSLQTSRQRNLDMGEVSWRRTHASLGLGWQSLGASSASFWQASADAGLLLGWLTASGSGFAPNDRQDVFEYGVGAGLRGKRRIGAWAVWLEFRTNFWARQQRAVLSGSLSDATLPRFDLLAILGVSRLILR
jgi:hypothetical protein